MRSVITGQNAPRCQAQAGDEAATVLRDKEELRNYILQARLQAAAERQQQSQPRSAAAQHSVSQQPAGSGRPQQRSADRKLQTPAGPQQLPQVQAGRLALQRKAAPFAEAMQVVQGAHAWLQPARQHKKQHGPRVRVRRHQEQQRPSSWQWSSRKQQAADESGRRFTWSRESRPADSRDQQGAQAPEPPAGPQSARLQEPAASAAVRQQEGPACPGTLFPGPSSAAGSFKSHQHGHAHQLQGSTPAQGQQRGNPQPAPEAAGMPGQAGRRQQLLQAAAELRRARGRDAASGLAALMREPQQAGSLEQPPWVTGTLPQPEQPPWVTPEALPPAPSQRAASQAAMQTLPSPVVLRQDPLTPSPLPMPAAQLRRVADHLRSTGTEHCWLTDEEVMRLIQKGAV